MLHVVGIKNCSTVKKALNWLETNGISFTFQDVKKNPLTDEEVLDLVKKLSMQTVLNKRGTKWKSLNLNADQLSDQELFDLLVTHQTMIKRPVLVNDGAVMVGFDEEAYKAFLEIED
ncbi:MAG: arsenate reductase family protein [Bacteroidetes bacterium]|nr:arsenate reductase family protein [Bacteroidota bacterium]MCH8523270.1 arsenate reductase family protein [Balneolales bacterium]